MLGGLGLGGLALGGLGVGGYELYKHSRAIDKFFGTGHARQRVTRTIGTHAPYGVPIGHERGGLIRHFDMGGDVGMGTDTVPAYLTRVSSCSTVPRASRSAPLRFSK